MAYGHFACANAESYTLTGGAYPNLFENLSPFELALDIDCFTTATDSATFIQINLLQ